MSDSHHHLDSELAAKLSPNQSKVLGCLRETGEPMSAYAILDHVRNEGISHPPTVYRALKDLIKKGMVHRLESRSAFVACGHGACEGRLAFAICQGCNKVVEIHLSEAEQSRLLDLAPSDIVPEKVTLEIAGFCESCRPAPAATA